MPLKLALAVRGAVAGHRLGALEGRGGASPRFLCIPPGGGGVSQRNTGEWENGNNGGLG